MPSDQILDVDLELAARAGRGRADADRERAHADTERADADGGCSAGRQGQRGPITRLTSAW